MLLVVPLSMITWSTKFSTIMSASFKGSSSVFTIMEDLSQVRTTCTQQCPSSQIRSQICQQQFQIIKWMTLRKANEWLAREFVVSASEREEDVCCQSVSRPGHDWLAISSTGQQEGSYNDTTNAGGAGAYQGWREKKKGFNNGEGQRTPSFLD